MNKFFEIVGRAVIGGLIGFCVGKLIEINYSIDQQLVHLDEIKKSALKK